tara:strand:+ start:481 stop:696 length:216 start_codon:yes stop_codon:yes gene_type:complete
MMYVIAIVMFMGPDYKVASNQLLYTDLYLCEEGRRVLTQKLLETAPTGISSAVFSKCVGLTISDEGLPKQL